MDKSRGVGLGVVIIILIAAALLFNGIKFSTSTINNTSNNYTTTEGVFSHWTLTWNVTGDNAVPVYITPAALVTQLSTNTTFRSITNGARLAFWTLTYPSNVFDPTSTINNVYNLYENGTANTIVILGQDGSQIASLGPYKTGATGVSIQNVVISPNGLYIGVQTKRSTDLTYRFLFYTGS